MFFCTKTAKSDSDKCPELMFFILNRVEIISTIIKANNITNVITASFHSVIYVLNI